MRIFGVTVAVLFIAVQVSGHGMVWDPPNRSSMWRFGYPVPPNYDDNGNYCGGISTQWQQNGGRCGICGDNFADPQPRKNENGGLYGTGIVPKTYPQGSVMPVTVRLNAAHLGAMTFQICNLDGKKIETEECFQPLRFADGSLEFKVPQEPRDYNFELQLPQGLTCKQCVLRWHYQGANNYGTCDDGTTALGCGPQETFRNCVDVGIF